MLLFTKSWRNHVQMVAVLIRVVPVISWGGGAVLLGTAAAIMHAGIAIKWPPLLYAGFAVFLLQGISAHAFNDVSDWRSGTDQKSPGILSGGSGVLKQKLLSLTQLRMLGFLGIMLSLCLGIAAACYAGPMTWLFLGVGIWAATAYTCSPFRLAYIPLAGEWLAAWPAMVACTVGTTFLLCGTITPISWILGIIHATLSVAWLMQHHLPDIAADLQAIPPKNTTVAYIAQKFGWRWAVLPSGVYFLLAGLIAIWAVSISWVFYLSFIASVCGVCLAFTTKAKDAIDCTRKQVLMITISCLHFISLFVLLIS